MESNDRPVPSVESTLSAFLPSPEDFRRSPPWPNNPQSFAIGPTELFHTVSNRFDRRYFLERFEGSRRNFPNG